MTKTIFGRVWPSSSQVRTWLSLSERRAMSPSHRALMSVAAVTRQECTDPGTNTFGAPIAVDPGTWPVGVGLGLDGFHVVETYFPLSATSIDPQVVRIGVVLFVLTYLSWAMANMNERTRVKPCRVPDRCFDSWFGEHERSLPQRVLRASARVEGPP